MAESINPETRLVLGVEFKKATINFGQVVWTKRTASMRIDLWLPDLKVGPAAKLWSGAVYMEDRAVGTLTLSAIATVSGKELDAEALVEVLRLTMAKLASLNNETHDVAMTALEWFNQLGAHWDAGVPK